MSLMILLLIIQSLSRDCLIKLQIQHIQTTMESEKSISFVSRTLMGRDQQAKLHQLLSGIVNAYDSVIFREPVDWKSLNLMDYPTIITNPMDLSTVKKKIAVKNYQNVQDCLEDIILIWENAKTYNPKQHEIHKLADKFQKQTKKMIKNYLPFVKMEAQINKKKGGKKQVKPPVKPPHKGQQPKTYLQKQEQAKNEQMQTEKQELEELPEVTQRKNLLYLLQLCSKEQIGVIFLLIRGNCPQSLQFDQHGNVNVNGQKINDNLLKRLTNLMQMWGISLKSVTLTNKKK